MDEQIKNIPCIILAGGLGTRLNSVVKDVVKPMALMGHKPFLHVLLDHLYNQGLKNFILALGHKAETVSNYFDQLTLPYSISYSIEKESMGTAGALRLALTKLDSEHAIAINGDTFFDLSLKAFIADAEKSTADFFMALKANEDAGRYGNVVLNSGRIIAFKTLQDAGNFQNAGIYWLKKTPFLARTEAGNQSLELDVFPNLVCKNQLAGKNYDGFFIDIGIPDDYLRAQNFFAQYKIDKSWTLFLDRDGVINERIVGDYIKKVEEFRFLPGALEAIVK